MKKSLLGLSIAVTLIPVAVMTAFIVMMGADISKTAKKEFQAAAVESAKQAIMDIRQMCDVISVSDEISFKAARKAAVEAVEALGKASLSENTVKRYVKNQDNSTFSHEREMRLLKLGNHLVDSASLDDESGAVANVLASLKERFGCDFSILAKIGDSNDMLRVATTLVTDDGETMVGTYIPAISEDGWINPVIDSLINGSEYSGMAYAGLSAMSANYIPLKDESGAVIGAIFYGGKKKTMAELEKLLRSFPVGETGTIWVVDDSDSRNPILRISGADPSSEDVYIQNERSNAYKDFLNKTVAKCKLMRQGEIAIEIIPFTNEKKSSSVKIVTYTYYAAWNWIIGTVADAAEYSGSEAVLSAQIGTLTRKIVFVGIFFTILAISLAWFLASKMARPVKTLMRVTQAHSEGDMKRAALLLGELSTSKSVSVAEFSTLTEAMLDMTKRMSELIALVGVDGGRIASSSSEISKMVFELENISENENLSMRRVAKTGDGISISSEAVKRAARVSAAGVERTLSISRAGGEGLSLLKKNYDALTVAADTVVKRLDLISGNSEKITEVVFAINDLSRRINLLSLNASVEAEKAGELGLGFGVVARRIRKLADKTSKAAQDMESIIRQMRGSVNSGVMEMDKFDSRMRQSSRIIIETASSLTRMISDIEKIGPKFEDIASRVASLSNVAQSVSDAMNELEESSEKAGDRAAKFKDSNAALDGTASILLAEVSRFKISSEEGADL